MPDKPRTKPRLAIVGATGQVGGIFLRLLKEKQFGYAGLDLVASSRSAGRELEEGRVIALEDYDFSRCDIAFFSAGKHASLQWSPRAAEAGALVIDNSSAFRMHEGVPLVVPEVNGHLLKGIKDSAKGAIIANPNCSTIQMVVALAPVHKAFGLQQIDVSTYQAVSGAGKAATEDLRQKRGVLGSLEADRCEPSEITANAVPWIGSASPDSPAGAPYSDEELKLRNETRKILDDENIIVQPTCVRVPVEVGHSEVVTFATKTASSLGELKNLLADAPGIVLLDDGEFATARSHAALQDQVFVSRLRPALDQKHRFTLWVVACNLYKGAALNGLQIAEVLGGSAP